MRRMGAGAVLAVIVAFVLGCGGSVKSGDRTDAAAACLKNALANRALGGGNNCGDSTASTVEDQGTGTRISVTCTHQNGDQYVCDVKVPRIAGVNLSGVTGGFYSVVYDGRSIVYQPA